MNVYKCIKGWSKLSVKSKNIIYQGIILTRAFKKKQNRMHDFRTDEVTRFNINWEKFDYFFKQMFFKSQFYKSDYDNIDDINQWLDNCFNSNDLDNGYNLSLDKEGEILINKKRLSEYSYKTEKYGISGKFDISFFYELSKLPILLGFIESNKDNLSFLKNLRYVTSLPVLSYSDFYLSNIVFLVDHSEYIDKTKFSILSKLTNLTHLAFKNFNPLDFSNDRYKDSSENLAILSNIDLQYLEVEKFWGWEEVYQNKFSDSLKEFYAAVQPVFIKDIKEFHKLNPSCELTARKVSIDMRTRYQAEMDNYEDQAKLKQQQYDEEQNWKDAFG